MSVFLYIIGIALPGNRCRMAISLCKRKIIWSVTIVLSLNVSLLDANKLPDTGGIPRGRDTPSLQQSSRRYTVHVIQDFYVYITVQLG